MIELWTSEESNSWKLGDPIRIPGGLVLPAKLDIKMKLTFVMEFESIFEMISIFLEGKIHR
jgi:hypothetical protein